MENLQLVPVALCRMIIGGTFWVASRLFYSIEFHGLEYDTGAPRTYLAISHRRDLDPIISLPTLLSHRGWRAWAGDMHFSLRDDAFSPGYLAHLLPSPRWLSHLLHPLSLGPVLRWLGTHPEAGRHVDQRLLQSVDMRRLAAAFLMYAARHGLVYRTGHDTWKLRPEKMSSLSVDNTIPIAVPTGHVGYDQAPLAYAWNDLQDMLSVDGTLKVGIASLSPVESDNKE